VIFVVDLAIIPDSYLQVSYMSETGACVIFSFCFLLLLLLSTKILDH